MSDEPSFTPKKSPVEFLPSAKEIHAEYDDRKEFVIDPKGYFLIRINRERQEIEVAFCPERNKISVVVKGKKPLEIYQTILRLNLTDRQDHAAYLGRELQKAYDALLAGIEYVQDSDLDFSKQS